jgi:hypothetical protein
MNDEKSKILPEDFDGVFRFTNFTGSEFKAKWDNKEYTFPAGKTVPLVIPNATPLEIQSIRKKFAKELAVACFYQSDKFKAMNTSHLGKNGEPTGGMPSLYTDTDIAPFVQRCLEPLPIAQAKVVELPKDNEDRYVKNTKGRPVTRVVQDGESLIAQASGQAED